MRRSQLAARFAMTSAALALAACAVAVLVAPSTPAVAGDEKHQAVRGFRATFSLDLELVKVEVLLGNGDHLSRTFSGPEELERIRRLLELATNKSVSLYADLKGKQLAALTVEWGAAPPYDSRSTE